MMLLQYSHLFAAPPVKGAPQFGHFPWLVSKPGWVFTPRRRTKVHISVNSSSDAFFAAFLAWSSVYVAGTSTSRSEA